MRQIILFIFILWCQSATSATFVVEGNSRTAESYIKKLASRCLEKGDVSRLEQCLMNSKLFSEVTTRENKNQITIEVKERWTLLPIPMIGGGGESTSYGLMVMDTNAFGRGKMVILGGNISADGHMGIAMLKDRSFMLTNWTAQLFVSVYKKDQYSYSKKNKLYGYQQNRNSFFGGFGYQITKDLEVALNFGYGHKDFDPLKNLGDMKSYDDLYLIEKIEYKGARYKFYFEEGPNVALMVRQQIRRSDGSKKYIEGEFVVDWQQEVWNEQALQISCHGGYSSLSDVRDSLEMGQRKGFRGTEDSSLWLSHYFGFSFDYQIPIRHLSFGTWTWSPFLDWTRFKSVVDLGISNHLISYGVGTYLYLKKIAIPGLGLEFGYNPNFRSGFFSFSVGFRM